MARVTARLRLAVAGKITNLSSLFSFAWRAMPIASSLHEGVPRALDRGKQGGPQRPLQRPALLPWLCPHSHLLLPAKPDRANKDCEQNDTICIRQTQKTQTRGVGQKNAKGQSNRSKSRQTWPYSPMPPAPCTWLRARAAAA